MRPIVLLGTVVVSLLSVPPAVIHVVAGTPPQCQGQMPTVLGTSGNDTLAGTPGNDVIAGLGGDDVIRALGGKDRICPGNGDDHVIGGSGGDFVDAEGTSGSDVIALGPGPDFDIDGTGSSKHYAGGGRDFPLDLEGTDTYHLGSGDDTWDGGSGRNVVYGGPGSDFLRPWHNVSSVSGIVDELIGDSGNDLVDYSATSANTGRIRLHVGRARVHTSLGGATLLSGIESAMGGHDRDLLVGDEKTNFLAGSNGSDVLIGKGGSDHLDPVSGSSLCGVLSHGERIRGGAGSSDWLEVSCPPGVKVDLAKGTLVETAGRCGYAPPIRPRGSARVVDIENISTTVWPCPDVLRGDHVPNVFQAGAGDDVLFGKMGADALFGKRGDDKLDGGYGVDRLAGGSGVDLCRNGEQQSSCDGEPAANRDAAAAAIGRRTPWPDSLLDVSFPRPAWLDPSIRM